MTALHPQQCGLGREYRGLAGVCAAAPTPLAEVVVADPQAAFDDEDLLAAGHVTRRQLGTRVETQILHAHPRVRIQRHAAYAHLPLFAPAATGGVHPHGLGFIRSHLPQLHEDDAAVGTEWRMVRTRRIA